MWLFASIFVVVDVVVGVSCNRLCSLAVQRLRVSVQKKNRRQKKRENKRGQWVDVNKMYP